MNYKKSLVGSVIALVVAFSCCWLPALFFILGWGSLTIGISDGLNTLSLFWMVLGAFLLAYTMYSYLTRRKNNPSEVIRLSTITCPACNHAKEEIMPINACQYFYECSKCNRIIKPKERDCCVFCSYGSVPCPPIQRNKNCC